MSNEFRIRRRSRRYLFSVQLCVWCVWFVGTESAFAQRSAGLVLGGREEIPAAGITFRGLRQGEAVGLSQPQVFHYRSPDGSTQERFRPRDLWYPRVALGRWETPSGVALLMGVLGPMMPKDFPVDAEHVTYAEYQVAAMAEEREPPSNLDELKEWLRRFTGIRPAGSPRAVQTGPRLDRALAFEMSSDEGPRIAYVFQFVRNVHGVDPDQWFVALFELPPGTDTNEAVRRIEREFLGSLATRSIADDPAREAVDRVRREATDEPRSVVSEESLQRALQSIRGMPGWWHRETSEYVVVSDLIGGRRSFIEQLTDDLERLRTFYARIIPPRQPIAAVSVVRVFSDGEDYIRYVGAENRDTAGVWIPSRRELVVRPFEWGRQRERRERLARVIYHEAFHQYLFYAFNLIQTSPWYNEGHATFFEGTDLRREEIRIQEVERYAETMETLAAGDRLPLEELLRLDYDAFYDRFGADPERRQRHYALAWGLIYYLRKGAPLDPDNRYEDLLEAYEEVLWESGDAEEATRWVAERVDMEALAQTLQEFWLSSRSRRDAMR